MRRIAFTEFQKAEVVETSESMTPLLSHEVRGRTLISLVSPGTELNWGFCGKEFPSHPGYSCVFQIEEAGDDVKDFQPGTLAFSSGNHAEKQRMPAIGAIPLPNNLKSEDAVFARLAGVSMSTLNTTQIHAPANVLVTGLGPVGNLAAQIFQICGYHVTAVDPFASRQESARQSGLKDVHEKIDPDSMADKFHLHVECSGHEQAVLDGARCVRKGGEVFLVGVPWKRRTEVYAFELLDIVFHRYVSLRSGWEWQVPDQPLDFNENSIRDNLQSALGWIAGGRMRVDGMADIYAPSQAQEVYAGLLNQTLAKPTALFDWRKL